jgi:hypothetical protein
VPSEIIAWAKVQKLGSDNGTDGFTTFSYTIVEPTWEFTANATAADRAYLQAELDALTGGAPMKTIVVTKSEDFAAGE